jgi:hypothetical protein
LEEEIFERNNELQLSVLARSQMEEWFEVCFVSVLTDGGKALEKL